MADLRKRWICVDQHAGRYLLEPRTQGIDTRYIEQGIGIVAELIDTSRSRTMPLLLMRVVIGPVSAQSQFVERLLCERKTVRGIGADLMCRGIVAGRIVVAFFQEEHIMAKLLETKDVLQMVPRHS